MTIPLQQAYNTKVCISCLNPPVDVDTIVQQGGTSSGKTYGICLALLELAKKDKGSLTTVTGQDLPNLKRGALRDFENILNDYPEFMQRIDTVNKSEHTYRFKNSSIIEFVAYGTPQDAKNGKRDYLFVNEANGVLKEIYEELAIRTSKRIFIDYNPTRKFWVHELQGLPNVRFYITTYKDNPNCPDSIRRKIESYKQTNPERWKVYGLGLTGIVDNLVFNRGYNVVPQIPIDAKFIAGGIDFGYNDPAVIVEVYEYNSEWYIREVMYLTHQSNEQIASYLERGKLYYADSAEPKSIDAIQAMGYNVLPAVKGKDSIRFGIDKLKSKPLNITASSVNCKREFDTYSYITDKGGTITDNFEDRNNHSIDACRYALSNTGDGWVLFTV